MKHKTFKEYTVNKKTAIYPFGSLAHETKPGKYPHMETCFGSHSTSTDQKYHSIETSFGQHGEPSLAEEYSTEPGRLTAEDQIGRHKTATSAAIHAANKIKKTRHLSDYSTTSLDINNALHTKKTNKHKEQIASIDKSLDAASMDKDTHVYTGLKESPAKHFKNIGTGGTAKVHLPAYTSTTTIFDIARNFTHGRPATAEEFKKHTPLNANHSNYKTNKTFDHILKLHLPKGTRAGSIKHFAENSTENEILLHRGHNIEIHPHPTVAADGTHIWHARVISHTPEKV